MTQYLLDTNILLRAADTSSATYSLANNVITQIVETANECVIIPQVLIEFWVVATRPLDVNGLGWTPAQATNYVNDLLDNFPLWFQLVTIYNIKGKRTHDIRLLAVMKASKITHLLTFNPDDFIPVPNITIVHPQDFINCQ